MARDAPDHPVLLDHKMIMAGQFRDRIRLTAVSGTPATEVHLLQTHQIGGPDCLCDGFKRAGLGGGMDDLPVRTCQIVGEIGRRDGGLNIPGEQFEGRGLPLAAWTDKGRCKVSRTIRLEI